MCGGMGGFIGSGVGLGLGVGRGEGNGALPTDCTYDGASGRVECPPEERDGLSVIKSAAYTDAAGAAQQVFDSATTNTVNLRLEVSGTRLRRDGDTSTVQHASDRTVSGLAKGSERTIQGTSAGIETTTGTDSSGAFTAVRVIGDTIAGVVLPADSSGRPTYPPAGTIRRGMQVTVTYAGQVPSSSTRQEVVTFDLQSASAARPARLLVSREPKYGGRPRWAAASVRGRPSATSDPTGPKCVHDDRRGQRHAAEEHRDRQNISPPAMRTVERRGRKGPAAVPADPAAHGLMDSACRNTFRGSHSALTRCRRA
jgi:hypothetical protein